MANGVSPSTTEFMPTLRLPFADDPVATAAEPDVAVVKRGLAQRLHDGDANHDPTVKRQGAH